MDANLSISSFSASGSAASPGAGGLLAPGAELHGADFANLLRGLQDEAGRQDFAAADLAKAGLQAVALGAGLELITSASPVPDAASLLAFARGQGLDDGTLALLFGAPPTAAAAGQGGASLLAPGAVPAAWALAGAGPTPPGLVPGAAALSLGASPGAAALAAQTDALNLSQVGWQISPRPESIEVSSTGAQASSPEALSETLRLQLQMPREAIAALTRRLASLGGTGQAVAWGQLQAQALAQSPETLDLREFFSGPGALAEPGPGIDPDVGLPAGTSPALEAGRSAAAGLSLQADSAVPSQAAARAEHYQQLADRLGQALAQRLQAQIERGEWKLQMRMDPASLGRIDLELDMRAGGLDAVFRSDNPLTRELIAQGLPKLRDSLAQSGTTVAHVWVNGDSAGQTGGNPTPQFARPPEPATTGSSVSAPEAPALSVASAKRSSDSDWDVLA